MDWALGGVTCQDGPPHHDTFCQDEKSILTLFLYVELAIHLTKRCQVGISILTTPSRKVS